MIQPLPPKPTPNRGEQWNKMFQHVLSWLRVKVPASGLEITDHAIRWCRLGGKAPQIFIAKLSPGILQDGKILDRPAFLTALQDVRAAVFGSHQKSKTEMVVLSMGSTLTFMRIFQLPLVAHDRLEKAVALNLQMLAPSDASDTSSGWQVIREDRDQGRFEIAGMFIDRASVEDMVEALREVGFVTVAAESKAVSLARVVTKGQTDLDQKGDYIGVAVDDVGMDFIIIRNGVLCFEYALLWREFSDPQGNVSGDAFAGALARGIRQIVNFYQQHWSDIPMAILVAAGDMFDRVREVIAASVPPNMAESILPIGFGSADSAKEVPVAFGAALRGIGSEESESEITFLGADAIGIYQEQRTLFFLRFWRVVIPLVLGLVLIAGWAVDDLWLSRSEAAIAASLPNVSASVAAQLATFAASAQTFNQSVKYVQTIESSLSPKNTFIGEILSVASANNVTLTHISMTTGSPVGITGSASVQGAVLAFKNALASTTYIGSVSLPLSAIRPANGGFTFSMTLTLK